ncbi:glycosyl transferase [Leuconostoc mesenteroides subsp. mesenteroides]|uniref:glycosyltransferase n=2 Tax=Leuconostoc mesenteroides TaxID=1245 RepID=UPI000A04C6F6|nr:glycosyltransferase [Leuconostoc mesenteroides]ORI95652.1 glycosyl transferase [Leuconostoc mesenteroides subsp. mesenteroides]
MIEIAATPIVIPSLEPDIRLINLLCQLRKHTNEKIIVVNDGSGEKYNSIFKQTKENFNCVVLQHQHNFGKGRAIKTALEYVIHKVPNAIGIITIDSDGQHTVNDVNKCIEAFQKAPDKLVLGTRSFNTKVPLRSKLGNVLTSKITSTVSGIRVNDTQTGLRVIPKKYFTPLLSIEGDRFEFEMSMILDTQKYGIDIVQVSIETVYLDNNKSSHFRVLQDSMSIYAVFIKYCIVSLLSFLFDIATFALVIYILNSFTTISVLMATLLSRGCSSIFNYYMNKKVTFKKQNRYSMFLYYLLVVVQLLVSSNLVYFSDKILSSWNLIYIKIIVDFILFIASYFIQKLLIFKVQVQSDVNA